MRNAQLASIALFGLALSACPHPGPGPAGPGAPPELTDYSAQTSESLRAVHREAVADLRAERWQEALDTLQGSLERPASLTHYLTLLALVRIPEQALIADHEAEIALAGDENSPSLGAEERKVVYQTRAWIAGIQDYLADRAVQGGRQRPIPSALHSPLEQAALSKWQTRGNLYDAAIYASTKAAIRSTLTFDVRLQGYTDDTIDRILFDDLKGLTVPKPPAPVLPEDRQL